MKLRITRSRLIGNELGSEVLIGKHRIGLIHQKQGEDWLFEWCGVARSFPGLRVQRTLGLPRTLESEKFNDIKRKVRASVTDEAISQFLLAADQVSESVKNAPPISESERLSIERLLDGVNVHFDPEAE